MKNIRKLFLLACFLTIAFGARAQEQSLQNALNPDGTVRAGADGSYNAQGYQMRIGPNGQPVFVASTAFNTLGGGANNTVRAIAISGNDLFIGGSFTTVGNLSVNRIARYDLQTNVWNALAGGVNNDVAAIAVSGNDVYVGGAFTSPATRIARFNLQTNAWSSLGFGANGPVFAIAVAGNDVYVGGAFISPANNIARWNTQTNTWSGLGTGANGDVYAIAVSGNNVFVGGDFTQVGTVSANRIARWSTSGNWFALGSGANGVVSAITVADFGDNIYIGGFFGSAGAVPNTVRIARFHTPTQTWNALGNGITSQTGGGVAAIASIGNDVYVGGSFTFSGLSNIARFNTQTSTWSGFGTGANNFISAFATDAENLFVGGAMTTINGNLAQRIAVLNFSTRPSLTLSTATSVSATSATLNGTINPNGFPLTVARFDYSLDSSFTTGVLSANTTPNAGTIGSGTSPVNVSATISLNQTGRYYFRLVATNANGTAISQRGEFTNIPFPFPSAGLRLWLRADSAVTAQPVNGRVSQWNDISLNNNHATQTDLNRQPQRIENALNGRPVIRFDNGFLRSTIGTQVGAGDRALFIVYRRNQQSINAGIFSLVGTNADWNSLDGMAITHASNVQQTQLAMANELFLNASDVQNAYNYFSVNVSRAVSAQFLMNGGFSGSFSSVTSSFTQANTLGYVIGARSSNGGSTINNFGNNDIAEIILYDRSLPQSERAAVELYLAQRYGLPNPALPFATIAPPSLFGLTATLSGTINPNSRPVTQAQFQVSTDSTFATGVQTVNTTPNASGIGSGNAPVSVSGTFNAQANLTYFVRLSATNQNGTFISSVQSFSAIVTPPGTVPTAGLRLWLRADSAVSTVNLNGNPVVSSWQDVSGQNNHATQGTPANRPLFVANALNGRPIVRFDGVDDWLDGNIGTQVGRDRSLFIVYRRNTFTSNGGIFSLRSVSGNDWSSTDAMALTHGSTNNSVVTLAQNPLFYDGNDGLNTYRTLSIIRNVDPVVMRINGVRQLPTQNGPQSTTNTAGYRLGARASNGSQLSNFASNDVAEVLLYNRGLSEAERLDVEAYLAAKYGLGVNSSATPSVPQGTTGSFVLGNTGVTVTFTTPSTTTGSLSGSVTNARPNVVGSLPTGITNIAERFWTITQTGLTGFTATATFDLSTLGGIQNFNTLKVLRRNNASSPWVDVETIPLGVTRNAPFIIVGGLSQFSQFTIASDASNQLPVELTSFTARKSEQGVELAWQTASEQNNAGFEVERKSEGATWNTLGFVRGNGTTTEAQSYSFLDNSASGKVQYRLKQIDFDGQFEYSNIIEVDAGLPKTFELSQNYPNPFNPTTVINYQLPTASNVSLKIYDVLGKEVATLVNGRQEAGSYNFNFNASNLSSGVYFYRLQASATNGASGSNFVQTKKMMLVK
ncbi:MAG: T9SS type A sorting domain-containing protein [Chloroherpetonaceae bacterium]